MRRFIDLIKQKWLKDTSHTIILIALIIFVYLIVNAGATALNLKALDFTANKLYTLTEDSKKQIVNVDQSWKRNLLFVEYIGYSYEERKYEYEKDEDLLFLIFVNLKFSPKDLGMEISGRKLRGLQ